MTKPKFRICQKVWYMADNKPKRDSICAIRAGSNGLNIAFEYCFEKSTKYNFSATAHGTWLAEEQLFKQKEELLISL